MSEIVYHYYEGNIDEGSNEYLECFGPILTHFVIFN